jgi:hypothetical protein
MQAFLFEIEDFSTNRRFVKGTSFIGIHSEESKILGFDKQSLSRYSFEMQAFLSKSKIWGKIEIKIEDLQSSSHYLPQRSSASLVERKENFLSLYISFFERNKKISFAYLLEQDFVLFFI